jgi:16S rRNA (uracil1498-N3)-methyltransferase
MHLFFHPDLINDIVTVTPDESRHISVLRLKPGESLYVTDGKGLLCKALIADSNSKAFQLQIMERYENYKKHDYFLHVAIAPTKQMERFEWFLEKATELGIDEITPIICRHAERREIKTERLHKILQSAIKQSLKAYLPQLNEALAFDEFVKSSHLKNKFIANAHVTEASHLFSKMKKKESSVVIIGPEGDFSDDEIKSASENNFTAVNLGPYRLRTETAGIYVCAAAALVNI